MLDCALVCSGHSEAHYLRNEFDNPCNASSVICYSPVWAALLQRKSVLKG